MSAVPGSQLHRLHAPATCLRPPATRSLTVVATSFDTPPHTIPAAWEPQPAGQWTRLVDVLVPGGAAEGDTEKVGGGKRGSEE